MAELVDALVSEANDSDIVPVQVWSGAPKMKTIRTIRKNKLLRKTEVWKQEILV